MTALGTIRTARELGRTPSTPTKKHILSACQACGAPRWVVLVGGGPRKALCLSCGHTGPLGSNWRGDAVGEDAGRSRAIKLYPVWPLCHCGKFSERHHKDGNPLNNHPSNIAFLCRRHHMIADGRMGRRGAGGRFKARRAK
ncbi:hypothetical protein LCGC14_0481100 [marine sediment metagenome]|uniref:Uncharacterized protein n=1 Tax=marine sediment metagenome TaxID=412755 RepID=A0A0F9UWD6_9ZZZZ